MKFTRATLVVTVFACSSLTALVGCLDDTTLDDASTLATDSDPLVAERQRHCIVEAAVQHTPDDAIPAPARPQCFESFADAIFVATGGALQLGDDVTPEDLTRMDLNQHPGLDAYLIAIEYVSTRWDSYFGSWVVYSQYTCDDVWSLSYSNITAQNMNDTISSAHTFPGCRHGYHYEHANFAGARLDCYDNTVNGHDPCYYNLGLLDDRTSSIQWTNFF